MFLRGITLAGLVLYVLTSVCFAKDTLPIPISNLRNLKEADIYARELVAALKAEKEIKGEFRPIAIVHLGNTIPKELKWVITHLDKAKVPFQFEWVTQDKMQKEMELATEKVLSSTDIFLKFENTPKADWEKASEKLRPAVVRIGEDAALYIRSFFGMPNGVTFWVTPERSMGLKKTEARLAVSYAVTSAVTTAVSLYLKNRLGKHANILRAVGFMIGWTWLNSYEWRRISELMSQARYFREYAKEGQNFKGVFNVETEYKMANGKILKYLTNGVRSIIGNGVVYAAAFGMDSVFTMQFLHKAAVNTTVSAFARGWIDDWFDSKMPTVNKDGTIFVNVEKGQWTMKKWVILNSMFNMVFSVGKNMNLLGFGLVADVLYYSMGAIGVIKANVWDERFNLRNRWRSLVAYFKKKHMDYCSQTLLLNRIATTVN